jgi:hypothetical protein
MSGMLITLIIPEQIPSLLAVLGLLFCWELHAVGVRQGRIQPTTLLADLIPLRIELPMVGARPWLYLYMAKIDPRTCRRCRAAHAHVFSGRTPWEAGARIRCEDHLGCRCVVIPLEGRWPAVKQLHDQLNSQRGPVQLSEQDFRDLIRQGRGEKITDHDHLALRLLSAMLVEETNPQMALSWYSQVLAQATEEHHTLIRAAAYIRSAEFLEQTGHSKDALEVTRTFLSEFRSKERDSFLTQPQYDAMVARQHRLIRCLLSPSNTSGNWPR